MPHTVSGTWRSQSCQFLQGASHKCTQCTPPWHRLQQAHSNLGTHWSYLSFALEKSSDTRFRYLSLSPQHPTQSALLKNGPVILPPTDVPSHKQSSPNHKSARQPSTWLSSWVVLSLEVTGNCEFTVHASFLIQLPPAGHICASFHSWRASELTIHSTDIFAGKKEGTVSL